MYTLDAEFAHWPLSLPLVGLSFRLVFLFSWFSYLVGFPFWLVFLFSRFPFLVGFPFSFGFPFSVCLGEPKAVTCMLSPLGGAAEKPFPLPALVDIVKIKTSLNAKAGENVD